MNVVIVINRLVDIDTGGMTIGGIQTYIRSLADFIYSEYGVKAKVAQFYHEDAVLCFEKFDIVGYKVSKKNKESLFKRIENDFSADDTFLIWGSDQYSVSQSKYRSINIQHGIAFDTVDDNNKLKKIIVSIGLGAFYKFLQRSKARALSFNGDITVCVDYNFKNWVSTYSISKRERFVVIPNFSSHVDEGLRFLDRERSIVVARRFVKRRGIKVAVEAAEKILGKHQNITFYFAGSGPEQYLIEQLREKYPRNVVITQFKAEDSVSFHSRFKYALLPSVGSEGTSFSLLEAMGAGCCVVCTDVGGMTNIVLDNFNGRIVSPNKDSIANAFDELLMDEKKGMMLAENGFDSVKYSFSREQWGEKWKKVLSGFFLER